MGKIGKSLLTGLVATPLVCAMSGAWADDDSRRQFKARLSGYNEVPATLSTTGSGEFRAKADRHGVSFEYELSFHNLEGDVRQAHIHFGQAATNGGISIWLCGTATNPGPAGTPDCGGPRSGGASRTVTAADVIGPAGQGITAMQFEEVLAAMRAGATYANVHSSLYTGGEIRGQISRKGGDD